MAADARLMQATSLRVQEAALTGESEAVLKDAATLPKAAPLGDRLNMVFNGTAIAQGTGRAVVTACGMATEMGAIAAMLEATADEPTPLEKEVGRIGRMLGIAIVVIALVVVASILLMSDIRGAAVDARMWSDVIQTGLVIAAATLLTIDLHLPGVLNRG